MKLIDISRLLVSLSIVSCCTGHENCPDCETVQCYPAFDKSDCPDGYMFRPNVIFGCCPACVKYLELGDSCDDNFINTEFIPCTSMRSLKSDADHGANLRIPRVTLFSCGPPNSVYQCVNGKCIVGEVSLEVKCAEDEAAFQEWIKEEVNDNACTQYLWERKCNPNGVYQRVQAKYSTFTTRPHRRFCVDPFGTRIFGDADYDDESINCMCSRKLWELENVHNEDNTMLHCDEKGNFEPLECDEHRCWCVNSETGLVTSRVVHRDLVKYLSCFNVNTFGAQYMRRCESRKSGRTLSSNMMAKHGLNWLQDEDVSCSYDGSFSAVNCKPEESRCGCVDKFNNWIGANYGETVVKEQFQCTCVRDQLVDSTNLLECDDKGNYKSIQSFATPVPGIEYCVDEDGIQTTPIYSKAGESNTGKKCRINHCPARQSECQFDESQCEDCTSSCIDDKLFKTWPAHEQLRIFQ